MIDLIIMLAEMLGGTYELLADGTVRADDFIGSLAACGAVPDRADCVVAAVRF